MRESRGASQRCLSDDGPHDLTAVVEAPDDVTINSLLYSTGALGNIRTETLRAFTRQETEEAIAKM
jgi:uncharacterized protein with GYD domain